MLPFLRLINISKHYGGVRALKDVNLFLAAGEVHCFAGENGSGKSTLIKIISGIVTPDAGGEIEIGGTIYPHLTPAQSTALGIQVIYQDLSLFPNLTVAENIGIGEHRGPLHVVKWSSINEAAKSAMDKISQSLDLGRTVADLPIASRQAVAICRALAANARLVIMDEPTASLTRPEVKALLQLIDDLRKKGITIVFVSHKLDEVLEVADRVTVMRDGESLGTFEAGEMDGKRLGYMMTGKEFHYDFQKAHLSAAPVVLSVKGLSRSDEFADVSFEVRAGEILGIIGLLGAGRTELAMSLFGMNPPTAGEVWIEGKRIVLRSNQDAIRHGIAYVSEDRLALGLILPQPISANIVATILDKLTRWGLIDGARRDAVVRRQISDLAIKVSDPEAPVSTLSGGNQQRVVLAKWLTCNPCLLILDSPTVGVDVNAKDGIYELVRNLAAGGVAVIMISDEIPEILYHTHRILVMRQGRFTSEHVPELTSEQQLVDAMNA